MNKRYLLQAYWVFLTSILSLTAGAQDPSYLLELRNDVQVSSTVYEFDIYLLRTGTKVFEYASGQYGIVINPMIINEGTVTASMVPDSPDPVLAASNQTAASVGFYAPTNVIRISAGTPPGTGNGALISNVFPGTKVCRIRLSNTVPFGQSRPDLTWTTTTIYPTQVFAYVAGINTSVTNHADHTTINLTNPILNVVTSSDNYVEDDHVLKIYPNPSGGRFYIEYSIEQISPVSLCVFDIGGKEVRQLVNEVQHSGSYYVTWIPDSQPEGIYILKLQTGAAQQTCRVTLLR